MATLDQKRAALAYDHVLQFKTGEAEARKYATIVHKMPALLRTSGLCQALHFVDSRRDNSQRRLLDHFALQLARVDSRISSAESLLRHTRESELDLYLRLTTEALACADWYRRLVQSELKISASEADDSEHE